MNCRIGQIEAGEIARTAYVKHAQDDDFGQPGTLYREVLSATDRDHLVTNIVGHLKDGVKPDMQQRAIQYWSNVDASLGARIRSALEGNRAAREGDGAAAKGSHAAR
jgi:catalase